MASSNLVSEIKRVDAFLEEIFQGLGMRPGSICRIASKYLVNWGLNISQDNLQEIEKMSKASSIEDWEGGSPEMHFAIENAIQKSGLSAGNSAMNMALAGMAVPIMGSMISGLQEGELLRILDVGAGNGDTTSAILSLIGSSSETEYMAGKCHFHLLEPSYKKAEKIGSMLESCDLKPKSTIVVSTVEEHLEAIRDGYFHIVASSAVFHHMSTPSHLDMIYSKMAEQGVLVIGDWYLPTWSQPAFLIPILRGLGAEDEIIDRYCRYFKIRSGEETKLRELMLNEQKAAHIQMVGYILCLSNELRSISGPKIRIFEAHQSLQSYHEGVGKAGFCLDLGELKQKHTAFVKIQNNIRRMYQNSEIACVWAAGKLPQKRNC